MANTLDEILQTYFGCKVPFRKDGELTTTGIKAYKRLENLLNDLYALGVIPSASDAVRKLDEITHEDEPKNAKTEALDYVRSQIPDWQLEEYRAEINSAYEYHTTPTAYADFDRIRDLLEEYGQEHELPEGWWENEGDLDDWLYEL